MKTETEEISGVCEEGLLCDEQHDTKLNLQVVKDITKADDGIIILEEYLVKIQRWKTNGDCEDLVKMSVEGLLSLKCLIDRVIRIVDEQQEDKVLEMIDKLKKHLKEDKK